MTLGTIPMWPEGLTDETPLPYRTWKVLNLVDGHLSTAEVARLADVSEEEVGQALAEAAARAQSHARLLRPVDEALKAQITRALGELIGPIAGVIVDEVMDELGPQPPAGSVFQKLSQELEPQQRASFAHRARELGLA